MSTTPGFIKSVLIPATLALALALPVVASARTPYKVQTLKSAVLQRQGLPANAKVYVSSSLLKKYSNPRGAYLQRRVGTFKIKVRDKVQTSGRLDFQVTRLGNIRLIKPAKKVAPKPVAQPTTPSKTSTNSGGSGYVNMVAKGASYSGGVTAEGYARLLQAGFSTPRYNRFGQRY